MATKTTALANYDKELAALAQLGKKTSDARAGSTGKNIGTQGGRFSIEGVALKPNADGHFVLDVVVADSVLLNTFYTPGVKFDPKNPASPVCYAFGRTEDEMVAHPESTAPQGGTNYEPKGGELGRSCVTCWANQWESAEQGKGKACKNGLRLGLITADTIKSAETIAKAETRFLGVPPMSGRNWAAHTDNVMDTFSVPVLGVVTQIEITPGTGADAAGGGHTLTFEALEEVDKKLIGPLIEKHRKVAKEIDFPFMKPRAKPAAPARGGKAPATPAKGSRTSSKNTVEQMTAPAPTPANGRKTKY